MNLNNEAIPLNSLLIVTNVSSSKNKSDIKKKLRTIEKLTRENRLLENKLESLRVRIAVEGHPYILKYCEAKLFNLELLEENLGNPAFKRKERKKIIELLIEGAAELWNLGDYRASKFLNAYVERDEHQEIPQFESKKEERRSADESSFKEKDSPSAEIKSLYRDLVKSLHPDKEMDEKLKEEKNLLMKKVTDAYTNNDLYTLLKLAADHLGADNESEGRIENYLNELRNKIKKLKDEKIGLTRWGPLAHIYQLFYSRNPAESEAKIKAHLAGLRIQVKAEETYSDIYSDDLYLKTYLRELILRDG